MSKGTRATPIKKEEDEHGSTNNAFSNDQGQAQTDGIAISACAELVAAVKAKTLDANRYATKKTIAQGMLDIALLTANASQLKYVLTVGEKHEFYTLMLTLIIVSIVLQVIVGILCLSLNLLRDCRLHLAEYHESANFINYFTTACSFVVTALNLLISVFDPSIAQYITFDE